VCVSLLSRPKILSLFETAGDVCPKYEGLSRGYTESNRIAHATHIRRPTLAHLLVISSVLPRIKAACASAARVH
jgi:hypothetical protein